MNTHLSIGINYEGRDADFLGRVLPFIRHLELTPDSMSYHTGGDVHIHPDALATLRSLPPRIALLIHGVGLSIGSYDGCSAQYLGLLDELFATLPIQWHSEHLAYTRVGGEDLGTMLTLPRTREVLDLICGRVSMIQHRYKAPFLLENVVQLLPPGQESHYTEAGFLNAIAEKTGCGLIVDVYNLVCDRHNFAFDPLSFLEELDIDHVYELHLAGGVIDKDDFRMDVHSGLSDPQALELAGLIVARGGRHLRAVTFEILEDFIPTAGVENIIAELQRLEQCFNPQHEPRTAAMRTG